MAYTFEKLTPKTDADTKEYKEAFDFVFLNNDVRNVAISGAYSAGKSSVLESYKQSEGITKLRNGQSEIKKMMFLGYEQRRYSYDHKLQ